MGTDHLLTTMHLIVIHKGDGNCWADTTDGAFTPKYNIVRYGNWNFSSERVYYSWLSQYLRQGVNKMSDK